MLKLERYAYTQRTPAVMDSVTRPHSEVKKGFMISSERMQALIDVSFDDVKQEKDLCHHHKQYAKGCGQQGEFTLD